MQDVDRINQGEKELDTSIRAFFNKQRLFRAAVLFLLITILGALILVARKSDRQLPIDNQATGEQPTTNEGEKPLIFFSRLVLLGASAEKIIDAYGDDFIVYGQVLNKESNFTVNLELNNIQYLSYSVNDSVKDGNVRKLIEINKFPLGENSFIGSGEVDYTIFHFEVNNLLSGENVIELSLYNTKSTSEPVDSKTIIVNRLNPSNEKIKVELISKEDVNNEFFFNNILHKNLDLDAVWRYTDTQIQRVDRDAFISKDKYPTFGLEIKRIGNVNIKEKTLPLYMIRYHEPVTAPYVPKTIMVGYVEENLFKYFTNAISRDQGYSFMFYAKSSPYILPDTVGNLNEEIPIPNSSDKLVEYGRIDYCDSLGKEKSLFNFGPYKIYPKYIVVDKYGFCSSYNYEADYFEDYRLEETKMADDFTKLDIVLSNGTTIDEFYNPFWYWCAGSRGYRKLPEGYSSYLEKVGTTSTGKSVYILSQQTPPPGQDEQQIIPSKKDNSGEQLISPLGSKDNSHLEVWSNFLGSQNENHPILIIQDALNDWLVFIRRDYLFLPGC